MKKIKHSATIGYSFEQKLKDYSKLSKAIVLKPLKNPKSMLPLGAAFLAGIPASEAVIIYSGIQNITCGLGSNTNRCYANIDQAGGNDLEIHRNHAAGDVFIQIDEVPGGGFSINGFHAQVAGAYVYPYANAAGVNIGAGGPWGFNAGQANTLSELNNAYPNDKWTSLPNGTTRFVGLRGTIAGQTRYGWIRITKNSFGNFTLVDWAFENTGASILTGATAAVSLAAFDGRLQADAMHLTWRTAEEVNNAGFEVERSEDGINYRSIAWVDGHGTTTDFKDYSYDDKNLRKGKTYYYRLRQVDNTGEFHFSPIVTATVFGDGPVVSEFYPNPSATGQVSIDFAAQQDGNWSVTVYDVAGKELRRVEVAVTEGLNPLSFDFSGIQSGLYFIKMDNGNEKLYRRLTIK